VHLVKQVSLALVTGDNSLKYANLINYARIVNNWWRFIIRDQERIVDTVLTQLKNQIIKNIKQEQY